MATRSLRLDGETAPKNWVHLLAAINRATADRELNADGAGVLEFLHNNSLENGWPTLGENCLGCDPCIVLGLVAAI